jgi:hypothetical protein
MYPSFVIFHRRPFARPALPGFSARIGVSDFQSSPLPPLLFRLVGKCASPWAPTIGSPWLPRVQLVRLGADLDPGVARVACRCVTRTVTYWAQETIGTHQRGDIGTRILQGQLDLLPLRLSSFRAYASSIASPRCLQGSIPGPWLAVTGAGIAPA